MPLTIGALLLAVFSSVISKLCVMFGDRSAHFNLLGYLSSDCVHVLLEIRNTEDTWLDECCILDYYQREHFTLEALMICLPIVFVTTLTLDAGLYVTGKYCNLISNT